MSRIGKRPIPLPKGVTVTVANGRFEVKGPKGTITKPFPSGLAFEIKENAGYLSIQGNTPTEETNRQHGTTRAHLATAVTGVSEGFKANLKLEGTGYKAESKGSTLNLTLGLSHPVTYDLPKSVTVKIPPESKGSVIQLDTFDKDALGQTVANLQAFRPPEPYKGKGVRKDGQKIRRKAGKAGAKGSK